MKTYDWIFQPLTTIALAMLVTLNLTIYFFWFQPGFDNLNETHQQLGDSLVRHLAYEATTPLYSEDRVALSDVLNRFADEPVVISASVRADAANGIQLSSRTKQQPPESSDEFQFPIHFSNEQLGSSHLTLSRKNINSWRAQTMSSWVLFNLLSGIGLMGFIYARTYHYQKQWQKVKVQLDKQLPEISRQLHGTPEQQLKQLLQQLHKPLDRRNELITHIQSEVAENDTERLIEQVELVSNVGNYQDISLVSIQCQNWDELIRRYPANELQNQWSDYETIMMRVSELYSGIVLPDGFTLIFGLGDNEEYVFDSICAARVVQLSLQQFSEKTHDVRPIFGITVSAGPAFISKTYKHGIPLPLVTGDADVWLSQLKALQPVEQIILAEPVLQDAKTNQNIETSLLRDVTLMNGQRLEVWELERLKTNDDLLYSQARTITETMESDS